MTRISSQTINHVGKKMVPERKKKPCNGLPMTLPNTLVY